MTNYVEPTDLPGYDGCGTIVISYRFPDGIQGVSIKGVSARAEYQKSEYQRGECKGVVPTDQPGYDGCSTIAISYRFPDRIQGVSIKGVGARVEPTDLPGYDG